MPAISVLVVEDEKAIRELLTFVLERADFAVMAVENAEDGQGLLKEFIPDMILLDWMLPGLSGAEWARRLKRDKLLGDVPIIMVTARGAEEDKVRGLDVGADDYITKPFSPRELLARIRAVLRRMGKFVGEPIEIGNISLDPEGHRLLIGNQPVNLARLEFRLLEFFMTHPDKVYSRTQLLDQVWGRNTYIEERTVDVHIRRLRKALAEYGCEDLIQTVRGFGYRFSERV